MNQIKRIIHSTMGKVLVLCAFALTLAGGTSAAFYSRGSGSAEPTTGEEVQATLLNYQQIDYPNAMATAAIGINNHGHMVGFFVDDMGKTHGFLYIHPDYIPIDFPAQDTTFTAAYGINDSGQIVGNYFDGEDISHGYIRDNGFFTRIDLPDSFESFLSTAKGINNSGQIVGLFAKTDFIIHGYLLNNDMVTQIDYPEADSDTFEPGEGAPPIGINDFGNIVGQFLKNGVFHGYLRTPQGGFTPIDVPFPNAVSTSASGINLRGQIVGGFTDADGEAHGFRKDGSDFTQIDVQINGQLHKNTTVFGINNGGQMVGWFTSKTDGKLHGFVATNIIP
jgi:probable HAF family extracellular repeat protein